jgi:hypothetical protein
MNLTLPLRTRSGSVAALMSVWPSVGEVVRGAHGFICSNCIASTLALSGGLVTMATLGLGRLDSFETAHGACGRCGARGRVIRARPGRPADRSL